MTKEFYFAMAFTSGLLIAIQAGINSQLRIAIQHPVLASLISFVVGGVLLVIVYTFTAKSTVPVLSLITHVSAWKFLGGIIGAIYIFTVIMVAPQIGAANTLCFAIAGQVVSAIILDHFGWVGFPVREASFMRIAGAVLIIIGVYLVQKK